MGLIFLIALNLFYVILIKLICLQCNWVSYTSKGSFSRHRRKSRKIYARGRLPWNTLKLNISYTECACLTKFGVVV